MMLFRIEKNGKAVLHEDVIQLCPKLKKINQKELLFLIYAYDYKSPYHQYPELDRVKKAKLIVWGSSDVEHNETDKMREAKEEYISLQYDSRRELMAIYQQKIVKLSQDLINEDTPIKISKIDEAITLLQDRLEKLQTDIDKSEDVLLLKGDGKLSMIEIWQKNQREYKRNKAKTGIEYLAP